ncbi:MAG TPA: hypothetical protein VFL85_05060 [Candidatus Saccharimonadales bacterium]|nr:hypothetical protein [Candidatus Saccharimonadales bacterium]
MMNAPETNYANHTAERLRVIYPFSDEVLAAVDEVAGRQQRMSCERLLATANVLTVRDYQPLEGKPVKVLDIIPPNGEYEAVQVFHLPMAGSMNLDRMVRTATLAAAQPTKRLVAVGNAGEIGAKGGKLSIEDAFDVWKGDLAPTVSATMQYLEAQGIEEAEHVGGSFGADKAVEAAVVASRYDQSTTQLVAMDPASVKHRSPLEIKQDFARSEEPLSDYVRATACPAYYEARHHSGGILRYKVGLFRLSNLAVAHALTFDGFGSRINQALAENRQLPATLIWGSASELADDRIMQPMAAGLTEQYPERFRAMRVPGQRHAMMNDIYLNAALVLQGLAEQANRKQAV